MEYLPDEDMTTEPTTDSTKYAPESGEYDDDYSSQTSTVPESLEADEATTPPTTAEDDEEEEEEEEEADEEYVPTCSNGYPGVESSAGDVCCPVGCSECGGEKCQGYGGCCEQKIHDDGVLCSDEGVDAGPCILIPGTGGGKRDIAVMVRFARLGPCLLTALVQHQHVSVPHGVMEIAPRAPA